MAGKLTDEQMDRLELWMGQGPKSFTLLYAISRDGCNASTFHKKCDNQGPTITVLYNPQGSVYGGYASTSWNSNSQFMTTKDSFLFQLSYSGNQNVYKQFMIQESQTSCSMYCNESHGPTFGYDDGHDLYTFNGSVNSTAGYFPLNGDMECFGKSFYSHGKKATEINNGTMNVTELEVYKVSDGPRTTTWRKTRTWNDQFLDQLKAEVESFKPKGNINVNEVRILMIGPVGAGKSSYYNTINSLLRGRITHRARSGAAGQSLTTTYTPYTAKSQSGASLKFRFCDTLGLEETKGFTDGELAFILDGNIPDYYQFGPTALSLKTPGFKLQPALNDQIHCAVFMIDSTTLEVLSTKLFEKMRSFQNLIDQRGIPQLVIITKIDKLCSDVEKNLSVVFESKKVEQQVEKASQLFGVPRSNVLPVKNYEKELELDVNINILALIALKQILNCAEDYLENVSDRIMDTQRDLEKLQLQNQ